MITITERAAHAKARITEIDTLIQGLDQQAQKARLTIADLKSQMATSDNALRNGTISDRLRRERNQLSAQIGHFSQDLADIQERRTPYITERARLVDTLSEALKPIITATTLQGAVDTASSIVTDLEAKRPAAVTALAKAQALRGDVEALEQAERAAADALSTARADAFLSTPGAKKREAADEAVGAADMALSIAREKADTGRAALPRIEAAIAARQDDIDSLDARIAAARQALKEHTFARDMTAAKDVYNATVDSLITAAEKIEAIDRNAGGQLLDVLRSTGLHTLAPTGQLELPQRLRVRGAFLARPVFG